MGETYRNLSTGVSCAGTERVSSLSGFFPLMVSSLLWLGFVGQEMDAELDKAGSRLERDRTSRYEDTDFGSGRICSLTGGASDGEERPGRRRCEGRPGEEFREKDSSGRAGQNGSTWCDLS